MGLFLGWLLFSLLVGALGKDKNIGFWGAFIFSLLLSPLIGLIIVVCSGRPVIYIPSTPVPAKTTSTASVGEELTRLKSLLDNGAITQEEFETQKRKLLA